MHIALSYCYSGFPRFIRAVDGIATNAATDILDSFQSFFPLFMQLNFATGCTDGLFPFILFFNNLSFWLDFPFSWGHFFPVIVSSGYSFHLLVIQLVYVSPGTKQPFLLPYLPFLCMITSLSHRAGITSESPITVCCMFLVFYFSCAAAERLQRAITLAHCHLHIALLPWVHSLQGYVFSETRVAIS